ncbi:MAG TPA: septal ring lytic transglycosylase RlpA family protein [Acidobacteriaceae bacterium]|jgi:rare lipoprotein A|nr:septal ring lytic transglycosylase RlpA family protein [Acidobacteriaceae bacterium]
MQLIFPVRDERRFLAVGTGFVASLALFVLAGCSHKPKTASAPPPPPPITAREPAPSVSNAPAPAAPAPRPSLSEDEEFVATHEPIFTQTGIASWYGPPYHNRVGANGLVYDENGISAAHRTLPMGSLIRVTNVRTGESAVMRITDRGPFVAGRILDLSIGAAKAVGLWRPGTGEVRIDVYSTPKPMDEGGRWCVQIGAFGKKGEALHLQDKLEREYRTANVIEFSGPTGYWVRIRPANDDRSVAEEIAHTLRPEEGEAWLVRLD